MRSLAKSAAYFPVLAAFINHQQKNAAPDSFAVSHGASPHPETKKMRLIFCR